MPMTVEYVEYEPHEPDRWYAATCLGAEPAENSRYGDQAKLKFQLDDDPDREQFAWCSLKLSKNSKLTRWATSLNGKAPGKGDRLSIEELFAPGRRVALMFELVTGSDGQVRDRVDRIAPIEKALGRDPKADDGDDSVPF